MSERVSGQYGIAAPIFAKVVTLLNLITLLCNRLLTVTRLIKFFVVKYLFFLFLF